MAANRINSLQNLVLMWRLHAYSCYIAKLYITPSTSTFGAKQCMQ